MNPNDDERDMKRTGEKIVSDTDPEQDEDREEEERSGFEQEPETTTEETPLTPEQVAETAIEITRELLSHFPKVPNPRLTWRLDEGSVWVEIEGDPSGRLIGRKGQTIEALEHIVSKMVSHRLRKKCNVHVDAEHYRKRRREKLIRLAHETADYVAKTDQARALEPMSPADRRIVHMALKDREDVITASEGKDQDRFVVIWPNREE